MSFFLHIPFPEDMEEEKWFEKAEQLKWLEDAKILPVKLERSGKKNN